MSASVAGQIKQVVLFRLGDEQFAVPIDQTREVLETPTITAVPNSPAFILGVLNLRGKILPVLDLSAALHLPATVTAEQSPDAYHVIVAENSRQEPFGIKVDHVTAVTVFKSEDLKPAPPLVTKKLPPDLIEGVIMPEDQSAGSMILLIDLLTVLADVLPEQPLEAPEDLPVKGKG